MKVVIVRTQAEFDALPTAYEELTRIEIRSEASIRISIANVPQSARVEARGSAHVVAQGSAHVVAWESAHVEAWESAHVKAWGSARVEARGSARVEARGSAHVEAWGSAHVVAWDSARVEARDSAHVEARDSAHVEARGSARVEARGSARVEARGSARVEARGSAHVEAWGSAHVEARESAHVEAWGSAHVEAWESAHVEAWESAHVKAWGSVTVRCESTSAEILLFWFSVCLCVAKGKILWKSKMSTVVDVTEGNHYKSDQDWLEFAGVAVKAGHITIYKRVSAKFLTREGTQDETDWTPGRKLEHKSWNPNLAECDGHKYYGCPAPSLCDQFRETVGDRYVALRVAVADFSAWKGNPAYPLKVGFRACEVLYECDRFGKKIEAKK